MERGGSDHHKEKESAKEDADQNKDNYNENNNDEEKFEHALTWEKDEWRKGSDRWWTVAGTPGAVAIPGGNDATATAVSR